MLEFHESGFKADVLFPLRGIRPWLLKRRPALCRNIGKLLDLSSDETVVAILLDFLHSSTDMPVQVMTAYENANSIIQQNHALIWPMLLRAEAWHMARVQIANDWGGKREGAGRKLIVKK